METEKEYTLFSPVICLIFVPFHTPQLRCFLPGAAVASLVLYNLGKEQPRVSSISQSPSPKAETSTLMGYDTTSEI